jgi:Cu/Ag efflux pump CusA
MEVIATVSLVIFLFLWHIPRAIIPVITIPIAYTKTLSMFIAALLAITLDPALRLFFTRLRNFDFRPRWLCRVTNTVLVGTIHSEDRHPISRVLIRLYQPVCEWSLRLLYLNTRSIAKTGMMLLAVPFSAIGAMWLLYILYYNMSFGVWVGLIALLGVDVMKRTAAP